MKINQRDHRSDVPRYRRMLAAICLGLAAGFGATQSAEAYSGEVYTVCKLDPNGDNFLSLRDCASSSCRQIRQLGPGTFLWTTEPYSEAGWRPVIVMRDINDEYPVDGPSGYVFDRYICRVEFRD